LASGSYDTTIKLWSIELLKEVATLKGHKGWVWSVAFSPDSRYLASGSYDKTVKLWNVEE
jgi:WD40 repeat protein